MTAAASTAASTKDLATEFARLLAAGDFKTAEEQFWSPHIVSVEAMDGPMARAEGLAAVQAKGVWWYENHTVHSLAVEGPWVNGDQFILRFGLDFTPKTGDAAGQRIQSTEGALYTVSGGKIVEERFFYD